MHHNLRSRMALAAGLLLLLSPLALPAQAATNSDTGTAGSTSDDFCDVGLDADTIYDGRPQGDDNTCDNDQEDTSTVSTFNGGVLTGCANAGGVSTCSGGFIFNADTAFGAGNFDDDWPIAESVMITATDLVGTAGTGFNVRTSYIDAFTGVVTVLPTAPVCMANGAPGAITVNIGGGEAWDPPANTATAYYSITQVVGFRASTGACVLPANAGPRSVTGDWTYSTNATASADANVAIASVNADGSCNITWNVAADSASRFGAATGSLDIDGGLLFGYFVQDTGAAASVADDETTTGINLILPGEWITAAALGWGIGATAGSEQTSGTGQGPNDLSVQCPLGPPDPSAFVEPACIGVGLYDGATNTWTAIDGVCGHVGDLAGTGPVHDCSASGNTVTCTPPGSGCAPNWAGAVAAGLGGDSRTVLACDAGTIADANTATAGFPVAAVSGLKTTATQWSCTMTFTPTPGADSRHVGVCLDTFVPF